MSILLTGNTMERITDGLSTLTVNVKLHNSRGRTDINAVAEDFYCGLLNIVLDRNLSNLNALQMDFPAIDLADREAGLCVQVTSTEGREKVEHTLEKFYERDMQLEFKRLIILVIGEKKDFRKVFPGKGNFTFDPKEDIWDTAKLLAQIDRLSAAKQAEVDEYLQKCLNIPTTGPKPIHLPVNTSLSGKFVGRERELQQMAEALEKGVKPLVIWGLGGMGKTELVSKFGRAYRGGNVYMALFREDLRQTVADSVALGIPELRDRKLSPEQRYELSMDRLRQCPAGDILIIDNADIPGGSFMDIKKDPVYSELCGLPLRLVFTTRMQDRDGIELRTMDNSDLYRIFERHGVDLTRSKMDALIAAVNAHTMTVDLMARTLDESWEKVTPEMILEAMASSTLPEADYPEVYNDRDPEQRQIYAHLRSLFNLTNIPEDGKQALRCATLLPPGGMDPALFLRGLPEGPAKAIKLLEKQGWVQRANHLLTIHPVVRLVCRTELEPTEKTCWPFVKGVWGWYDEKKYDKDRFRQLAELMTNASETLGDPDGWYIGEAGYFWSELGEFRQALKSRLRTVELREKSNPDSDNLATAYNNVGLTYGNLGNHPKALEYNLKALAIKEKVLPPGHPGIAISYNNVGYTYCNMGDHKKGLEYQLKALAIWEKVLPPEHQNLATSYNNVGVTYDELGDHEKALDNQLKALVIREKILPPEHPSLAMSYNNVGSTYGDLGDRKKELDYQLKALTIFEQVLPTEHPFLATSCNNIAWTYHKMGQYETAWSFMCRAAQIAEQSLPEGHRDCVNYRRWAEQFEHEVRQQRGEE